MSEEVIAEQPQVESPVESVSPELERNSWLGTRFAIENPTDSPATSVEEEVQPEVVEAEAPEQDAAETEPEDDSSWLPDEQSKVYTDEAVARYAKRYGKTLEDVQADPHLRQLLHDKINSDILIARANEAEVEEPTLKAEPEAPAVPQDPAKQRAEYYEKVSTFAKQIVDPASAEALGKRLLSKFGVDIASEDPEVQGYVKNSGDIGMTLAEGAIDIMNTAGPSLIKAWIEQAYPEFTGMYGDTLYMRQYEAVRGDVGEDGQPKYGELPDFGTKEFKSMLQTAATKIPGFEQMVFTDQKTGRALPEAQQARMRYQMLAQIASGEKPNPKVVAEAVSKGLEATRKADQTRKAGSVALGAGKVRTQTPPSGDDLNNSMIAAYNARNGSAFGR